MLQKFSDYFLSFIGLIIMFLFIFITIVSNDYFAAVMSVIICLFPIIIFANMARNVRELREIRNLTITNRFGKVSNRKILFQNSNVIVSYDSGDIIVIDSKEERRFLIHTAENRKKISNVHLWREIGNAFDDETDYDIMLNTVRSMKLKIAIQIDIIPKKMIFSPEIKQNIKSDNEVVTKPDNPVDVNNCSEEELCNLPGVNKITAKRIIKKRESDGGFESVEDFIKYIKPTSSIDAQLRERIFALEIKDKQIKKNNEREVDL